MARSLCIKYAGALYHVTARGGKISTLTATIAIKASECLKKIGQVKILPMDFGSAIQLKVRNKCQ
jgi:hypothetical protein